MNIDGWHLNGAAGIYLSYCVVQTTMVVGIFVRGESSSSPCRVAYVKEETKVNIILSCSGVGIFVALWS